MRTPLLLLLPVLTASCAQQAQDEFPPLADRYLGQTPPDVTPELFAPGIVNTDDHREFEGMFSADMASFYFVRRPLGEESSANVVMALSYQGGRVREDTVQRGASEPSVAPDGRRLYFKHQYIERTRTGWSAMQSLGAPLADIDIMRLSASANGTVYFDTFTEALDAPLRSSRWVDGAYEPPQSLGPQFAVGTYNAHPFIAPDESYIVFDSRRDGGYGSSDLYVSFRDVEGMWGPAINLGEAINTSNAENFPSISPDGQVLVFDRREQLASGETVVNIFWVSARFLETLRPEPT